MFHRCSLAKKSKKTKQIKIKAFDYPFPITSEWLLTAKLPWQLMVNGWIGRCTLYSMLYTYSLQCTSWRDGRSASTPRAFPLNRSYLFQSSAFLQFPPASHASHVSIFHQFFFSLRFQMTDPWSQLKYIERCHFGLHVCECVLVAGLSCNDAIFMRIKTAPRAKSIVAHIWIIFTKNWYRICSWR